MFKGADIVTLAESHVGEQYILGSVAPLANSQYRGPWDCAEFVSWCAYQVYGIIYAVRPPDPRRGESFSGWWYDDARTVGRAVSVADSLATKGAMLVRKPRPTGSPRIGHVAISLGDGTTIEAKDHATGVAKVMRAQQRLWDVGVFLPGVDYGVVAGGDYQPPQYGLRLEDPFMRGPEVAALQRALETAGIYPGGVDGVFGDLTYAAVVSFQTRAGLVADGYVGAETARALGLAFPITPAGEDVAAVTTAASITTVAAARQPLEEAEPEARPPHADPLAARTAPVTFNFEMANRKVFAVPSSGERFYIGYSVPYTDDMPRRGLSQKLTDMGLAAKYDRAASAQRFGKWAHFLWPTIMAESDGYFGRINSYDRAAFTFGCYQFAAHTPNENLILLVRKLLTLPSAPLYFPDLTLRQRPDGTTSVHWLDGAGSATDLEVARMVTRPNGTREQQIPDFMKYLNSDPIAVDLAEQTAAARLMAWCEEDEAVNLQQIETAIEKAKVKLREARSKLADFDGLDWQVALWINDILHQGRATYRSMASALRAQNPVDALSNLGASNYDSRKATVRKYVKRLVDDGVLEGWQPDLDVGGPAIMMTAAAEIAVTMPQSPPPEQFVPPIFAAVGSTMQIGNPLPSDTWDKKPSERPWELGKRQWGQKLRAIETVIHGDAQLGRFYRKFFVDEGFVDSTLNTALMVLPGVWASAVVRANR